MADETTTVEAQTGAELPSKFKDLVASVEKMSVLELH
jgi:hypothetical protein